MASVSVSHLILFIASMLVAASVAGVFTETVGQLSNAIDDQGLQVSQDVRTDVEVISDSGSDAVYDSGTITIHVKNTGSENLGTDASLLNIFVNGQIVTQDAVTATLLGEDSTWRSGAVMKLEISHSLTEGNDARLKVVVNGDEEVFEFRA